MSDIRNSVGDLVVRNAAERGHAAALIEGDRAVTWEQLEATTRAQARGLIAAGLSKGQRVATLVRNGITAVELLFVTARAGLISVPLNYGLTSGELGVLLMDSRPQALIVDAEFVDILPAEVAGLGLQVFVTGGARVADGSRSYESLRDLSSAAAGLPEVNRDDIRTIRYTSGTTATPKGCLGTHRQILASIDNFTREIDVPTEGPFLQMFPLFSGAGIWLALAAAYKGVTNVILREFNAAAALRAIDGHGVAHTCGVPTMLSRMAEELRRGTYDIASLRLLGYTGAKMPAAVLCRAMERFACDFYQGFGGGEMGGWVAFLTPQHHRAIRNDPVMAERMSSVGKPASYAEIRLRGVGDDQPVPAGELGEITVRSSSNFSGYLNRPDETADTLRGEWVYTGDVGYFDAEGFLFAVDRVKDLVITGGMNVASAEVEAVLAEHAAIESVAVIGLPSDEWGEAVTGVVVLRPDQSVSAQDLIAFARTRLAGYKVPKSIRFVTALPLNGVGKVLKRVLREQFQTR